MARGAALKGVSYIKFRILSAYNKPLRCTDVQNSSTMRAYTIAYREGAPNWRGPAKIMAIDDTGATVKFQAQTLKVARYCFWKKVGEEDVEEAEWKPPSTQPMPMETEPLANNDLRGGGDQVEVEEGKVDTIPGTGAPGGSPTRYSGSDPGASVSVVIGTDAFIARSLH